MIGILLNDTAYEQDIRELLMAFYPGETFVHEKQDNVDFYVEGTCTQNADETKFGLKITDPAGTVADEREDRLKCGGRETGAGALKPYRL